MLVWSLYFFFFFSSRRRHTRSLRDWSSDVCSSDLRGRQGRSLRVGDRPWDRGEPRSRDGSELCPCPRVDEADDAHARRWAAPVRGWTLDDAREIPTGRRSLGPLSECQDLAPVERGRPNTHERLVRERLRPGDFG